MGSQTTKGKDMSFRDNVKDNTKSVMIQTFITSLFADPQMRFGDILEDLIESDDPDDDWMRETLYDLEIGQIVKAGMKVMGLSSDDSFVMHTEDVEVDDDGVVVSEADDGIEYTLGDSDDSEEEEEETPPPKKKKKKAKAKKPPARPVEAAPKKKKKKKNDGPQSPPPKRSRDAEEEEDDPEWKDYLKLIIKALRSSKAYDDDTAVNNGVILNHIHGEDNWDKDESADLRRGMDELIEGEKAAKVGQRRGTRYHLR